MGVTTHRLTNGLTVMVKEWHAAPVAACCLGYAVGARDEQPGQAGISHWLEHLMFRGTARYPRGQLDRLIPRNGGSFNAAIASEAFWPPATIRSSWVREVESRARPVAAATAQRVGATSWRRR